MTRKLLLTALLVATIFSVTKAQVPMTTTGSYTQNFNALTTNGGPNGATWTDNSTIANWYSQRSGSGTTYVIDDGQSSSGNLYSYGQNSSSDRALGAIGSSTAGNFAHGVLLRNTSGTTITSITVTYTLEQWRKYGSSSQTISFFLQDNSL